MGVPEARMNRSRKGSRLCLNSTRLMDSPSQVITLPDSAPSSPELRSDKDQSLFNIQPIEQDSSQSVSSPFEKSPAPPVAPVASFYNLGNTCFMNCMLHVLRYTPEFVQLLGNLREDIEREEKLLKEESEKQDQRTGWQLLQNMHDLYTEMSLKESQYKELLPSSSGAMALRPYALLDSIRLLNPLFEGNMQHDAQELLRCLLCGLDDAELELRRIKQKRSEDQELLKRSSVNSGQTSNDTKPCLVSCITEKEESVLKNDPKSTRKQPLLKGGRRRYKKKEEASAASKSLLASFFKAKEVPGIVTRVNQPSEPIEGVGLENNKSPDPCFTKLNESKIINIEGGQVGPLGDATSAASNLNPTSSSTLSLDAKLSPVSMSSGRSSPLSDVIYIGESSGHSSPQPLFRLEKGSKVPLLSSDHEGYLNSVKHTEGRRSRLGVRGKAKTLSANDKKGSALTSGSPGDNSSRLFSPVVTGNSENINSENVSTVQADKHDMVSNSPKNDMESLSSGIPGSQRLGLPRKPSSSSLFDEADKIVELPLTRNVVLSASVPNGKEKNDVSPQPGQDEIKRSTTDESSSIFVLTPGKEISIHSPLLRKPTFYTPPPSRSRNLLSRLGHLIPNSARRFLSFSAEEDPSLTKERMKDEAESPSFIIGESLKETAGSLKIPTGEMFSDNSSRRTRDYIREAQIQLRRCDWLGVSPVKSVSARYVLKEVSKSQKDSTVGTGSQWLTKGQSGNSSLEPPSPSKRGKRSHETKFSPTPGIEAKAEKVSVDEETENSCLTLSEADSIKAVENCTADESSMQCPLPKRLKRSQGSLKEENGSKKFKRDLSADCKLLPKLSINLEKCDWLINAGEKSVKISTACEREIMCKRKRKLSPQDGSDANDCSIVKVEFLPSSASSPPPSDQPVPRLAYSLFGGTMSHQTRCCECESISDRSEEFLDISIPVPKASGSSSSNNSDDEMSNSCDDPVSLLLKSLASRERIYGENKYFCENCHHLVEAERSCHVTTLPKVLALHLKRFHANSSSFGGVCKINDHVAVPKHLPCLLHKCPLAQPTCPHRYCLYAVVTHSGSSIRHGHYRTYVRVVPKDDHLADFMREQEPSSSPHAHGDAPPGSPVSDPCRPSLSDGTLPSTSSIDGTSGGMFSKSQASAEVHISSAPGLSCHFPTSRGDAGGGKLPWWIECDDDFIQVLKEEEFFGKLSQSKGYLLGTPYVLFYHQTQHLS